MRSRSYRRFQARRAENRIARIRKPGDDRPLTHWTIGHGKSRSCKDSSNSSRILWGVKPIPDWDMDF